MMAAMERREKPGRGPHRASRDPRPPTKSAPPPRKPPIAAAERMIRERMNDATQSALVREGVGEMARKFG